MKLLLLKKNVVNDKLFVHIFKDQAVQKMETEAPFYEMILQMEAIELHKLHNIVKSKRWVCFGFIN